MNLSEQNLLELFTRNLGIGVGVISRDFRTLWTNDVLKDIFGDGEGRDCFRVFNQRGDVCPGCGVEEIFRTGKDKVVHEQSGWDAAGNPLWSEIVATPVRDARGEIVAAIEAVIPITKRKENEFQRVRLEHVVWTSPDLVSVVDRNYNYRTVNRAYAAAFSRPAREIIGRSMETLLGKEAFENAVKDKLDRCLRGEIVSCESWSEFPGTGRRFVHVTYYPHMDEAGQVLGVIVNSRDITTLKEREEETKVSHAHLRTLLENTDDYIMIADENGGPLVFNDAYARIMKDALGIEMKPGIKPHTLLEDKDTVAWWDALHRRALGGEKFTVDYSHDFGGGKTRHFEFRFQPIVRDGKVLGFCELTRDVTERVRAEEGRRQSEEMYRSVIVSSPMGVVICRIEADERLVVLEGNEAAGRILGLDFLKLRGLTPEEAFPGLAGTDIPARLRAVCRKGELFEEEEINYRDERIQGTYEVHGFRTSQDTMALCFRKKPSP